MAVMIETKDLTYTYPAAEGETNEPALRGVSVQIEKGSFTVVLGHNGSGKSTFAKHLNAVLLPSGGAVYVAGTAGERFCVRNSGAVAVAEGVGDHGCEYMTGGRAAILGPVGDNFAAGMSGGIAYVYDPEDALDARLNRAMVEVLNVDAEHAQELRGMLEKHVEMTDSTRARAILEDFSAALAQFKMIIPTEYRRLLEGR